MNALATLHRGRILRWGVAILGAILIGGGLLIYVAYQRDLEAARARVAAGSRVITTGSGTIEYAENGSGYPVLVIHGAGGGYDQGLLLGKLLLGDNYRLIAPSRFGYLKSPIPGDNSPKAQADAYRSLLQALGIERAAVVAISAGGPSGLQFALNYPENTSALVMVSAVSYTRHDSDGDPGNGGTINRRISSDFVYWSGTRFMRPLLMKVLGVSADVQARMTSEDNANVDRLLKDMMPMSMRMAGIQIDQSAVRMLAPDDRLAQIKAPTLVIHSRDDTLVNIADGGYTASVIPGTTFVPLENGGHFLVTHHAEVRQTITEFLSRHTARLPQASSRE